MAAGLPSAISGVTRYTIDVDVHPDVASVAVKHACELPRFLENYPISMHTQQAYARATKFVREFHLSRPAADNDKAGQGQHQEAGNDGVGWHLLQRPLPVVLDSGCGTGRSSALLAESYPHLPVLGIDRSAVRLSKAWGRGSRAGTARDRERRMKRDDSNRHIDSAIYEETEERTRSQKALGGGGGGCRVEPPSNLLLLRADLVDLWILASRDNAWEVKEHLILYPNPYPKRSQLRSRWHGHPVFPVLLGLGGRITLRSNWKSYLDEVCEAVLAINGEDGKREAQQSSSTTVNGEELRRWGGAAVLANGRGGGEVDGLGTPSADVVVVNASGGSEGGGEGGGERAVGVGEGESLEEAVGGRHSGGSAARRGVRHLGIEGAVRQTNGSKRDLLYDVKTADTLCMIPAVIATAAASYAASARVGPSRFVPVAPTTNFEAKYKAVGEAVYELRLEPKSIP